MDPRAGFRGFRVHQLGCSRNYGPLLVIDYLAAPNILGCQNGSLLLGTTQLPVSFEVRAGFGMHRLEFMFGTAPNPKGSM